MLSGGHTSNFHAQYIEKIVEAIALTLPTGGNTSLLGAIGGTLGTNTLESAPSMGVRFEEFCIRELAYDLGVNPIHLKKMLA